MDQHSSKRDLTSLEIKDLNSIFFETYELPVILIDLQGKIINYNKKVFEKFEYSANDLTGSNYSDFLRSGKNIDLQPDHLAETMMNVSIKSLHGEIHDCMVRILPIQHSDGEHVGFFCTIHDLFNNKQKDFKEIALKQLNRTLRKATSADELIQLVIDQFRNLLQISHAAIALREPNSTALIIEKVFGSWDTLKIHSITPAEKLVSMVLRDGTPLFIENNGLQEFSTNDFSGIKYLACIPLITSENQRIGVIWLGRDTQFNSIFRETVMSLAETIANAINRISISDQSLRALQETRVLSKLSNTLNQNLDLGMIFYRMSKAISQIIPKTSRTVIHILDSSTNQLHNVLTYSKKDDLNETPSISKFRINSNGEFIFRQSEEKYPPSMKLGDGIAGKSLAEGKIILTNNAQADPRFKKLPIYKNIQSLLSTPIIQDENKIGVFSLISEETNAFTLEDQELLENFTVLTITAINNAKLLESERIQRKFSLAQAEIAKSINKSLDIRAIIQLIINHVMEITPIKAVNIMMIEDEILHLYETDGYDEDDNLFHAFPLRLLDLSKDDILNEVISTKSPIVTLKTETHDPPYAGGGLSWMRSHLGAPILVEDELVGLINLDCNQENAFSNEIVEQIEAIANQASIAVSNARLLSNLKKSFDQEKKTRKQLIISDKLAGMGRMVASVAHELNNPLQTIKNCLFLLDQTSIDSEDNELFEVAISEVDRLSNIVSRLREVYRPKAKDKWSLTSIKPVIESVEKLIEAHLSKHQVTWNFVSNDGIDDTVNIIPDQMIQVLLNLCLNGIEAMTPDGGDLTIRLSQNTFSEEGNFLGIHIHDTGPGIPEEVFTHIFEPFFSTKHTGMGLGLSICYDITTNHNGRIDVSNSPEGGAIFTVWLPQERKEDKES